MVKNPLANARDTRDVGSIPGLGRFPSEGNRNPFQYFCLGNPMDREAWWIIVHRVAESETTEHMHTHTHACTKGDRSTWDMHARKETGVHGTCMHVRRQEFMGHACT